MSGNELDDHGVKYLAHILHKCTVNFIFALFYFMRKDCFRFLDSNGGIENLAPSFSNNKVLVIMILFHLSLILTIGVG